MVFSDVLVRVELPHSHPKRWDKLQALYQRLYNINDSETLVSILQEIYQESGHTGKDSYGFLDEATGFRDAASNLKYSPFSGLQIFLDEILNESERTKFYERTLPFIAKIASKLDELAPAEGIAVSCQQEPCSIPLDRKFIASLLASGFLCALPENNTSLATRMINFVDVFANFHRSELKDVQAAQLQSVLCYFERLASSDFDLTGEIILQRQVVNKSSLPSLTDWTNCDTKLCPIVIDQQRKITETDPTFLQVDFSDCFTGRNLLANIHGKQGLYFCTYPELLATSLFMGKMEENESLLIKGAERFSTLDISAKGVVHFAGDFQDSTERDICGNLQRTVASVSLIEDCDTQSEEELVLRHLNKALVCFYSQGTPCRLMKMTDNDGINHGYGEEIEKDKSGQSENNDDEKDVDEEEDFEETEGESGIAYIEDERSEMNGNIQLDTIVQFCDSLVSCALSDAKGEIGVKPRAHSEDTREVLEVLMKKSVHEVFKCSPEKQQKYEAKILDSPPIPKCLQSRTFKYVDNSPLVPGTPPSSPTKRSLVTSGNQSPVSGIAPPNTPLSEEVRLGTTSFADSLAESLMSCVMLSSSLATSIATIASTPLRSTSVAMETLQQSPVKRGQQILSSFLSPKSNFDEKSFVNGGGEFGLIDLSTENDVEDKSILYEDDSSEEENEARRRSLNELALNLFQDFASKLADSIMQSAKVLINEDVVLEEIEEEHKRDDDDDEEDGSDGSDDDDDDNDKMNKNGSGDLESEEDNKPENSSETKMNKSHDTEANTDDKESNPESQSTDSDSDSDQDSTEKDWEGVDIDKELEDRLYELDLTDNEEISNNEPHSGMAEMADSMVHRVLNGAFPEVIRELKENADLYAEDNQIQDEQSEESKSFLRSHELPHFPENGISTELYFGYATSFSTRILHEALVDVSKNAEAERSDGKNLEISSETENYAEKEDPSLCYSVEDLNEGILDENANVKLENEDSESEEFESGEINSKEFKIDKCTSISEEILDEFAHVLSEQLLETSVAIADSSIQLQDESLLVRPIATGSWAFEGLASDPELEAVIQWVAASAVGCPAVVYYATGDIRLEKFSKVQQVLRQRDWRIRDVMRIIMRYCQQDETSQVTKSSLFQMLLEECHASW